MRLSRLELVHAELLELGRFTNLPNGTFAQADLLDEEELDTMSTSEAADMCIILAKI